MFLWACAMLSPTQAGAATCEDLTKLNLPSVAIASSTTVPAGRFIPPGSSNSLEIREILPNSRRRKTYFGFDYQL